MTLSLQWVDQGWGNEKGDIVVQLIDSANSSTVVAEQRQALGSLASHTEASASNVLTVSSDVISKAQAGNYFRFLRNAGGGGGQTLTVKYFIAIATLSRQ